MSAGVRAGYKQTEMGVVPMNWQVSSLGGLVEYIKGFPFRASDYQQHGIRIIRVSDTKIDGIRQDAGIFIAVNKISQYRRWVLRESDLIVSTVGSKPPMYDSMVGKATLATRNDAGALLNQNAVILRSRSWSPHGQKILHCHLQQERYIKHLEGIFRGNANQASITLRELFEYPIAIPSDENEQRAIATALSDVDALLSGLDSLIAKKQNLKQAAMQQLLTGQTRLPGFSGEWGTKLIGEFADCTSGGTPSTSMANYWGGSIRWMSSGELNLKVVTEVEGRITEDGLRNSSAKMVPANCVLIGLAGQGKTRGTVAINLVTLCTNQSIAAILPNPAFVPEYVYYNLDARYDELRGLSTGDGGRGGLNLTIIRSLGVPFPTLPEQTAIATVLSDMDTELAALQARLGKTRVLKQGMMQELLTGRIRLV